MLSGTVELNGYSDPRLNRYAWANQYVRSACSTLINNYGITDTLSGIKQSLSIDGYLT